MAVGALSAQQSSCLNGFDCLRPMPRPMPPRHVRPLIVILASWLPFASSEASPLPRLLWHLLSGAAFHALNTFPTVGVECRNAVVVYSVDLSRRLATLAPGARSAQRLQKRRPKTQPEKVPMFARDPEARARRRELLGSGGSVRSLESAKGF